MVAPTTLDADQVACNPVSLCVHRRRRRTTPDFRQTQLAHQNEAADADGNTPKYGFDDMATGTVVDCLPCRDCDCKSRKHLAEYFRAIDFPIFHTADIAHSSFMADDDSNNEYGQGAEHVVQQTTMILLQLGDEARQQDPQAPNSCPVKYLQ